MWWRGRQISRDGCRDYTRYVAIRLVLRLYVLSVVFVLRLRMLKVISGQMRLRLTAHTAQTIFSEDTEFCSVIISVSD